MIKVNFHIHSKASFDGFNSFRAIYKNSKAIGLDAIAITDHDTIQGAIDFREWLKTTNKKDLEVIIGEEVTCKDGAHIIGLFLEKHIETSSPLEVIKAIKQQEGLVYFPHPSRKDGIFNSLESEEALAEGHFIEVFNAKINHQFNIEVLEKGKKYPHLIPFGGSDAHYNADLLKGYTVIKGPVLEIKERLLNISNKDVEVYGHKRLAGGTRYLEGYYKHKDKLNLPIPIKELAKKVFPYYKNLMDKRETLNIERII